MHRKLIAVSATAAILLTGCAGQQAVPGQDTAGTLTFSVKRYPHVADHARDAMAAGESKVCTIDRKGAAARRKESLRGVATAPGKDRDEFPPAVCKEGGKGADVRLVPAKENRSAGAWMSHQLQRWPDGTRVLVAVSD